MTGKAPSRACGRRALAGADVGCRQSTGDAPPMSEGQSSLRGALEVAGRGDLAVEDRLHAATLGRTRVAAVGQDVAARGDDDLSPRGAREGTGEPGALGLEGGIGLCRRGTPTVAATTTNARRSRLFCNIPPWE